MPPTCKRGPFVRCHALLATIESPCFWPSLPAAKKHDRRFSGGRFVQIMLNSCAKQAHFPGKVGPRFFTHSGGFAAPPRWFGVGLSLCSFSNFGGCKEKNKARIPPGCETVLIKITRPLPSAAPGFSDRLYSLCAAIFSPVLSFPFAPAQILPRILCRRRSFQPVSDSDTGPFFQKLRGEFSPNITAARQRPPALKTFYASPPSLPSGSARPAPHPARRGARAAIRPDDRRGALSALRGLLRGMIGAGRSCPENVPRKGKPPAGSSL